MAVFAADMTAQRAMTEALRVNKLAMDSAFSAIAIGDFEFRLTCVNRSFVEMWGFETPEEVLGRPAFDLWESPEDARQIAKIISSKGSWFGDLIALRGNGEKFFVQISTNVVFDENNCIIAFMGSFVDISEKRAAEKELQKKSTALKRPIRHLRS
jgi:PAS domain S-box-containing protein